MAKILNKEKLVKSWKVCQQSHITPLLKLQKLALIPSNPWELHSEWVSKESLWSIPETLQQQSQQQKKAPKTKEKLNMVSPPVFNNSIVNELHQDVQNFQGVNLRYFSKKLV